MKLPPKAGRQVFASLSGFRRGNQLCCGFVVDIAPRLGLSCGFICDGRFPMNEFVRLGRKAPGEVRFRSAASLERPPAFRLSEALLACGLPRERLLDEVTRAGEMGSDVIDLGLCDGQKF